MTRPNKVMAVDLGAARIGVAVSDGLGLCANPLCVLRSKGQAADIAALVALAREHEATAFVVGLPLNMNDTESRGSVRARAFAEALAAASGLEAVLWDERLSTVEAEGVLKERGVKSGRRRSVVDQAAAAVILQDYLDSRRER